MLVLIQLSALTLVSAANVNMQELEREIRIEKEKAEGGPDPRVAEMEALSAQISPKGTCVAEFGS